jgi:hypothetical protein
LIWFDYYGGSGSGSRTRFIEKNYRNKKMIILGIRYIIEKDWERLQDLAIILGIIYIVVGIACIIDLVIALIKARHCGIKITSNKLRNTIKKMIEYYGILTFGVLLDFLISLWYSLPVFTALGALGLILVEMKSYFEKKKHDNEGLKNLPDALNLILKNKDKLQELDKFLNENKKEDKK